MEFVQKATSVLDLLNEYKKSKGNKVSCKLHFSGVDGYDVYNISAPFVSNNKTYILGRVEKRNSEISHVSFFERANDTCYSVCENLPTFINMQDPFTTVIDGDLVVGGTQIDINPINQTQIIGWRTIFFKGKDVCTLKFWTTGPDRMKDVRIAKWENKYIVFARPQGGDAGMGKIAYNTAVDINEITPEFIRNSKIIDCHFINGEWGGANQTHLLSNGLLGVVGHISYRDSLNCLHYQSMVFAFNPKTMQSTKVKIIACRSDFEQGEAKRSDLVDVLFTGGLVRNTNGKACLYTGVSDCEAHFIKLDDPFVDYEKENIF